MKLPAIAVATLAVAALVGGTAAAQATMQPIPNPPEKAKMHMGGKHHGKGKHHHHMKKKEEAEKK
jgi:Spy/CpxP family protein refolding chaperone